MASSQRCEELREALSAYADGECRATEQKEVDAHLQQCPECRAWLAQVREDQQRFVDTLMGRQADLAPAIIRRVSEMSAEPPARQSRQPAPRLAELFVVVAMLAVVAVVLFPVFSKGREKARVNSCLSNLKQVALAMQQYAQDYDETLPSADNWADDLLPYLKNRELLICPSDPTPETPSYSMVPALGGRRLEDIPAPPETIVLYEVESGQPVYRHNGGMNVSYADGHTRWLKKLPASLAAVTAINTAGLPDNYGLRRNLQLAYDATCEVWVPEIQRAVVSAERTFYEHGGFVLSSTLLQPPTPGASRTAELVGKVPTAEVGATVNALATLGYVARRSIQGQDLTDTYVAQARAVTQSEGAAAEAQQRAERAKPAARPEARQRAREARNRLGAAQDALFGTQREVALATITVTLVEKARAQAVSATRVGRAWRSFLQTAGALLVGATWVALYALFLLPVGLGVWLWRRCRRGRRGE